MSDESFRQEKKCKSIGEEIQANLSISGPRQIGLNPLRGGVDSFTHNLSSTGSLGMTEAFLSLLSQVSLYFCQLSVYVIEVYCSTSTTQIFLEKMENILMCKWDRKNIRSCKIELTHLATSTSAEGGIRTFPQEITEKALSYRHRTGRPVGGGGTLLFEGVSLRFVMVAVSPSLPGAVTREERNITEFSTTYNSKVKKSP